MCHIITVHAETDDGDLFKLEGVPDYIEFDEEGQLQERTICTCFIGGDNQKSKTLRDGLLEQCIKPYLQKMPWGRIVIEVH